MLQLHETHFILVERVGWSGEDSGPETPSGTCFHAGAAAHACKEAAVVMDVAAAGNALQLLV